LRRQAAQEAAAADVLAALREGRATTDTWDNFEFWSGLSVPGSTRSVVDPEMDPAALVRYLAARQQAAPPQPQSLALVTLVPSALCLVPAVVVLALL
ncbi:MAG: hypothetical protein ACRDWY_00605, partial [Actinomycetes bacterium]